MPCSTPTTSASFAWPGVFRGEADDARDVVQETFLRAARAPESIPHGSPNEEAWLVRVLINICRDRWRHAAVRTRAAAEGHVAARAPPNPESGLLARAMVSVVVGTSRTKGDKALIALLTAVPSKSATTGR